MERLGVLKIKFDLTYSKLALLIGVTEDKAGNYLSGRTKMPLQKVIDLSAALRIDANWLLRGIGVSPIQDLVMLESNETYNIKPGDTIQHRFENLSSEAFGLIFTELQRVKERLEKVEEQLSQIHSPNK